MASHSYTLGKTDYVTPGRRNCRAEITWTLADGRFAMQAAIWQANERDCYVCGQCVAEVAGRFPHDAKAQRMLAIWTRWHLNDLRAGSPAQEAFLRANPAADFDAAKAALEAAGLQPDASHLHNGKPYSYGSAWLAETLPADVIAEIQSWEA